MSHAEFAKGAEFVYTQRAQSLCAALRHPWGIRGKSVPSVRDHRTQGRRCGIVGNNLGGLRRLGARIRVLRVRGRLRQARRYTIIGAMQNAQQKGLLQPAMKKHDEERRRILFIGNFAYSSTKTIASGAIRRLQDCPGVTLHIVGAHPSDEYGKYPVSTDCDGVITCGGMENPMARRLARRKPAIPFVFVLDPCSWPSLRPRSLSIDCDDRAIAAEAADLFVRHDLREFGYVGSRHEHFNTGWDAARREAFVSRLAEHGYLARAYSPTGRSDEEESAALAA